MEDKNKPHDRRAAFLRLVDYLKPHKGSVAVGMSSNVVLGLIGLIPPIIYGRIIDTLAPKQKIPWADASSVILWCAVGLISVYTANAGLNLTRAYVMHVLGERVILQLRKDIYYRLQMLSLSYFDNHQTGEIMSRVTNDSEVVEEFVNHAADTIVTDALKLVAMCAIILYTCSTLALVALVPIPIIFAMALVFSRRVRKVYRAVRERLAEINTEVQENISGIRVIKAFAREDHEYGNFCKDAEDYFKMRVKAVRMWTSFFPSVDIIASLDRVAVWVVGAFLVANDQMRLGTLVMFEMYLGMFHQPIGNLARINDTVQRSLAAAERIFEIVDEVPAIQDAPDAGDMPRIQGHVEFEHVDFRYADGEEVLRDICIKAEPGQIVALVGRSGAGKTSIVNLIPRFYDPIAGRVLVDGVDVRTVKQDGLRRQIAMVLQDTFLFNGTVRENIRYGRLDATDEEIEEAAKAANAHEFIAEMPSGYDTEIGENGIKLSGGQKQRMAIARAILADPRILILDEATSSVDSESEYLIHRAMDRLMEGRTTFVIAHRLSTVKHANQIITLEHGRVSEVGDHKSLLDQDGTYSQMYAMQFRLDEER